MKTKLILILFFLGLFSANAQWNLNKYNPYGTALAVINKDSVATANYNDLGRIYYTHNGGQNWSFYQTPFDGSWFLDMHFPTANVGYICGGTNFGLYRNVILKTTDAGITWDSLTVNEFPGYEFTAIHFVNVDTGFVASPWIWSSLLKTTDGGQTFTTIAVPDIEIINEIYFLSSTLGFVSGYKYLEPSNEYERLILKTTDLGSSWTTVYTDTVIGSDDRKINAFYFVDNNNGFGVGTNGLFIKTTNGGNVWSVSLISPYTNLTAVHFTSPIIGYINNAGGIYKTTNSGTTWTAQNISPVDIIWEIRFANDTLGYAMGDTGIYKTTNGGGLKTKQFGKGKIGLTVYPNPATEILNLKIPENLSIRTIELLDIRGKIIKKYPRNVRQIDISNLQAGNYFLQVYTNLGKTSKKIVVE